MHPTHLWGSVLTAFLFILGALVLGFALGYFVGYRQAHRGLPEVPTSPKL